MRKREENQVLKRAKNERFLRKRRKKTFHNETRIECLLRKEGKTTKNHKRTKHRKQQTQNALNKKKAPSDRTEYFIGE